MNSMTATYFGNLEPILKNIKCNFYRVTLNVNREIWEWIFIYLLLTFTCSNNSIIPPHILKAEKRCQYFSILYNEHTIQKLSNISSGWGTTNVWRRWCTTWLRRSRCTQQTHSVYVLWLTSKNTSTNWAKVGWKIFFRNWAKAGWKIFFRVRNGCFEPRSILYVNRGKYRISRQTCFYPLFFVLTKNFLSAEAYI